MLATTPEVSLNFNEKWSGYRARRSYLRYECWWWMVTEVVMVAVMLAVEEEVEERARNKHGSSSVNCLRLSRITIN